MTWKLANFALRVTVRPRMPERSTDAAGLETEALRLVAHPGWKFARLTAGGSRIQTISTASCGQGFESGSCCLRLISRRRKSWPYRETKTPTPPAGLTVRILFPPALRHSNSCTELRKCPQAVPDCGADLSKRVRVDLRGRLASADRPSRSALRESNTVPGWDLRG
jgi:hypothetical protein